MQALPKVHLEAKPTNHSRSRSIQDTINSHVDPSRVSDATKRYGLYMRVIMEALLNRSLDGDHNRIAIKFLTHLELRSVFILKIVSKKLYSHAYIINETNVPLSFVHSNPIIGRKCKNLTPLIKITKEMINQCPLDYYKGPIALISSLSGIMQAVKILNQETLLGFDTESQPAFERGVSHPPSLIQLAGENMVFIFQLHLTNIEPFKTLFENKNIKKVGVGVEGDLRQLRKLGSFKASGFVEISAHQGCKNIQNKGLQSLAAYLLNVQISKSKKVLLSNWAKTKLTDAQITYAATDAWISREIYMKLEQPVSKDGLN